LRRARQHVGGHAVNWTRHGIPLLRPTAARALAERNGRLLGCFPPVPPFGLLIVYIPQGRNDLAVEPVSHMPDTGNRMGLVSDQGLQVIDAGQRLSGTVEFAMEDVRGQDAVCGAGTMVEE